jgi:hypothetical protein
MMQLAIENQFPITNCLLGGDGDGGGDDCGGTSMGMRMTV